MSDPHALYVERRRRLLQAITPGVMIVPAAALAIRNNDVEHEYRQDSDAFYLTGFDEPESVVVLRGGAKEPFVMFVRPRDPEREVWDGARAGVDGAVRALGADLAHPIEELAEKLPDLLQNTQRLYYRLGRDSRFDAIVLRALDRVRSRAKQGVLWPTEIVDPATVLHEMRLIKSSEELELMRRAVEITSEAHVEAMARARPDLYEYEVEAVLRAVFRRHGSERVAYQPIVGSGPNATVLHYRRNDRRMCDGDLLLIDAGCEYGYYASDVTRTFPVNGRWTKPQREIYETVLRAQEASIAATKPGATLEEIHRASVREISQGLISLGLLSGSLDQVLEQQLYKPYYMHRTSHYIGMDVHDVGSYFQPTAAWENGKPRPLAPGTVITIEPGIYIADNADVPAHYRGIGVRIEDDVLVDAAGPCVLSERIPKLPEDVERACAG
jgi:Xaa-Pro aminopeptidase